MPPGSLHPPAANQEYSVILGSTFVQPGSAASLQYCTLRYDFKPASVSNVEAGVMELSQSSNNVNLYLPNSNTSNLDILLSGNLETDADDLKCIAIFEGTQFRLELVAAQAQTKYVRNAAPYQASAAGTRARAHQLASTAANATGVAGIRLHSTPPSQLEVASNKRPANAANLVVPNKRLASTAHTTTEATVAAHNHAVGSQSSGHSGLPPLAQGASTSQPAKLAANKPSVEVPPAQLIDRQPCSNQTLDPSKQLGTDPHRSVGTRIANSLLATAGLAADKASAVANIAASAPGRSTLAGSYELVIDGSASSPPPCRPSLASPSGAQNSDMQHDDQSQDVSSEQEEEEEVLQPRMPQEATVRQQPSLDLQGLDAWQLEFLGGYGGGGDGGVAADVEEEEF